MTHRHEVQAGESIWSLAMLYGFGPDTIWNHPENAVLKELRKDPNILAPGDTVFIPDKTPGKVSRPTGQRHRFRRRGIPAYIRVCPRNSSGEPYPNEDYTLYEEKMVLHQGTTDGEGWVDAPVMPDVQQVRLELPGPGLSLELEIGHLEPANTPRGIQGRLRNLGFNCPLEDEITVATRRALSRFQARRGITPSGEPDQETVDALIEASHDGDHADLPAEE